MQIAVISDTHDNILKLDELLKGLKNIDVLVHCGDLCSPITIEKIKEHVKSIPVHIVWGNMDEDKDSLIKAGIDAPNIIFHENFAKFSFDGLSVGVTHFRSIALELSINEPYDLILFGHTHEPEEIHLRGRLLVNPGEVLGKKGKSTYAVIETDPLQVEFREV